MVLPGTGTACVARQSAGGRHVADVVAGREEAEAVDDDPEEDGPDEQAARTKEPARARPAPRRALWCEANNRVDAPRLVIGSSPGAIDGDRA